MKCPQCHFDNRAGAQFCRECGQRFEVACPHCGNKLPPRAKYCDGCGHALYDTPLRTTFSPPEERKHVTVLFSDLSGYTEMSEKLDAEEVKEITSRIFGEAAKIVDRYEGFVEKYVGDAVMALFGVPKVSRG